MFCPSCGKNIPDNAKFCDSCGERMPDLTAAEAPAPAPAPVPTPPPAQPAAPPFTPVGAPPRQPAPAARIEEKKPVNKGLIIGIIAAVVVIAAVLCILLLGGSDEPDPGPALTSPPSAAEPFAPSTPGSAGTTAPEPTLLPTDEPAIDAPAVEEPAIDAPAEEEPADTPIEAVPEELSAWPYEGNYSEVRKLFFSDAYASSEVTDQGKTYYAWYAFDGDLETSWQEEGEGYGIGEFIELYFDAEVEVEVLKLRLGHAKSQDSYDRNGKPSLMLIEFSDGSSFVYEFPALNEDFVLQLSRPVSTAWVRLTILDAHPGTQWEDTCIAEVTPYGNDPRSN